MDCVQAREIVSEAFDRGVGATDNTAEAREHCRTCSDCRRFVEGLALLRKTPAPSAPAALVEDIVERARKMAEAGVPPLVAAPPEVTSPDPSSAETGEGEPFPPLTGLPRPVAPRREERDLWWWIPRVAVGLAATAAVLFTVTLSVEGFRAMSPSARSGASTKAASPNWSSESKTDGSRLLRSAPKSDHGAQPGASADAYGYSASTAVSARFVVFEGQAYAWLGDQTLDPSSLSVAGTLQSSLDTTSAPVGRQVLRSGSDADVIFIQPDAAQTTYTAFRRVIRLRGGKRYALQAGSPIDSYGQWPVLPAQFAPPTAANGAPTFVPAGKDDNGFDIYTPPNASADAGFAVAPGTASNDPAGADPNWTWWAPQR
jgi:hypothetical protein